MKAADAQDPEDALNDPFFSAEDPHGDPTARRSAPSSPGAAPGTKPPANAPPARGAAAPTNGLAAGAMSMTGSDRATSSEPPQSLLKQIAPPARKPMHPLAYALIAMSAVFGGVSAVILLLPPAPPPVIVMQVPNAGMTAAPDGASKAAVPAGEGTAVSADAQQPATSPAPGAGAKPGAAGAGSTKATDPKAAPNSTGAANIDMSGFGNKPVEGPSATGPDSAGAGSGGGQLSAGEINGVVAQNQALIRRKCWQPALDQRAGAGPSARVNASIVIGPSGNVQSASASGAEKDYPGLSSCIAGRINGWKFPPSSGATPVNVPFFFAAQ